MRDMAGKDISDAIEYLTSLKGGAIEPGLERIGKLLETMGNPQDSLKFVHIAGTNGKGSALSFISEILSAAGYKVGVYSSPAVFSYRERFRVGHRNISGADIERGVREIREAVGKMGEKGLDGPSCFEAETALAFWYFKEKNCDIAVIEAGMGGLLDATNVIPAPLACVFASISFDHMSFLGNTLEAITENKAGIIKPGSMVVSAKQYPGSMRVLEAAAREKGYGLSVVCEENIKDRRVSKASFTQVFDYGGLKELKINLAGKYQLKNAALSLECIFALRKQGLKISDGAIRKGLENASWPGRFQKISDKPCIIIDGAHNEDAAKVLADSIDFYFTNRRIIYIMGMLKDKEYDKVCAITAPKAESIFTVTSPGNPRALGAIELAEAVRAYNGNVTAADSLQEALEMAKLMAGRDGVIVVFGSLSFLGKITELADNGSGKDKKRR